MTAFYLFCLIVGGGLLLVSLLGWDSDADVDTDLDFDAEADADQPGGFDSDAGWGLAREFLSVRGLIYLLAGVGATGLLLEAFTDAPATLTALFALMTGILAAVAAGALYGWVRHSESGTVPRGHDHLVGLPARVVLPVVAGQRGKVCLRSGGREIELLARLYGRDDADCPRGTTVVIVDIEGDTALVTPAPSLPSETM